VLLIVGLGNPDSRYKNTRHNLGYMVLDKLAKQWGKKFKKGKGPYNILRSKIGLNKIILAKPLTYMNNSGIAVDDLLKRYLVSVSDLLILCDDLNLPLGKLRLRKKGSDGGHKGLISIINYLNTKDFPRLRLGIGSDEKNDTVEFVLSRFEKNEQVIVNDMIERACQAVFDFAEKQIDWTMNFYNG
jgi:PTH1 family peptidyl-tRNA hydrolase